MIYKVAAYSDIWGIYGYVPSDFKKPIFSVGLLCGL